MEITIPQLVFYAFAIISLICAVGVIAFRNPVTAAMNMAICFGAVAAIFFGLGAEFIGIIQIMVYAGAVLVLFLFVIMMIDIREEEKQFINFRTAVAGTIVASLFAGLVCNISLSLPSQDSPIGATLKEQGDIVETEVLCVTERGIMDICSLENCTSPSCNAPKAYIAEKSDTYMLGMTLFSKYNISFAILSFALLSACVGSIAISRQFKKD